MTKLKFWSSAGIVLAQLIMTQVVTFLASLFIPGIAHYQQDKPVIFALFLAISFSTGILGLGWLALWRRWLKGTPRLWARLVGTLVGTMLPLFIGLACTGKLEAGSPFFLAAIILGIMGFYAPDRMGEKYTPVQSTSEGHVSQGDRPPHQENESLRKPTQTGQVIGLADLQLKLLQAIQAEGLGHIKEQIVQAAKPAILIELLPEPAPGIPIGESKVGGNPDLPAELTWPEWRGRPMGFIAQFNLSRASQYDLSGLLPKEGLLSFFYDIVEQPWGYDPNNLGYSHVAYFPPGTPLHQREAPDPEIRLKCSDVLFSASLTLPVFGSRDYDALEAATGLSSKETDQYDLLVTHLQDATRQRQGATFHRLLGHSHNVQGDMQLEAELVTNGIYCGDLTGYQNPRRQQLEPQAVDWQLLFQLDTEDSADLMWGDSGMLYYWIKKDDLAQRRFEKHWMDLQCG